MLFASYTPIFSLVLAALSLATVTVAAGQEQGQADHALPPPVKCQLRAGPTRIKWVDTDLPFGVSGYLGISAKGQVSLEKDRSKAASWPFYICDSKTIGTNQNGNLQTGQIRPFRKCLMHRSGGSLGFGVCPTRDDASQTDFTFAVAKGTNAISAPAGGWDIDGGNVALSYVD